MQRRAGVIVPGDLVNILVMPDTGFCKDAATRTGDVNDVLTLPNGQQPAPGRRRDLQPARVLYQAAKVLFVDKTAVPQPGEVNETGPTPPRRTARPRPRSTPA